MSGWCNHGDHCTLPSEEAYQLTQPKPQIIREIEREAVKAQLIEELIILVMLTAVDIASHEVCFTSSVSTKIAYSLVIFCYNANINRTITSLVWYL